MLVFSADAAYVIKFQKRKTVYEGPALFCTTYQHY